MAEIQNWLENRSPKTSHLENKSIKLCVAKETSSQLYANAATKAVTKRIVTQKVERTSSLPDLARGPRIAKPGTPNSNAANPLRNRKLKRPRTGRDLRRTVRRES